jgi:LacI family repressor for deo operon, udp, cdd, tsx, nupC, and nupG
MKRPTIADVAREAGVSIATVSRVLNGTAVVTAETQARVTAAIARLGYRPNHLARSLPQGASDHVIGLVIPEISNPVFPRLAESVAHEAWRLGYQVMLCQTDNDPAIEAAYTALLIDRRVSGIIFVSGQFSLVHGRLDAYHACRRADVPYVLVNAVSPRLDAPAVATDEAAAGALQVRALRAQGHERLLFLGGSLDYWVTRDRLRGIREALDSERGHGVSSFSEALVGFSFKAAAEVSREVLTGPDRPTGILAASDLVAMAVLRTAWELGIQVPRDLSVIGFDGVDAGGVTGPPLTTVAQPLEEMGRAAVAAVLHQQPGRLFHPTLVERDSLGPAPGAREPRARRSAR